MVLSALCIDEVKLICHWPSHRTGATMYRRIDARRKMEALGAVGKSSTTTNNDRLVNRKKSPLRPLCIIVRTAVDKFAMYFLVKE